MSVGTDFNVGLVFLVILHDDEIHGAWHMTPVLVISLLTFKVTGVSERSSCKFYLASEGSYLVLMGMVLAFSERTVHNLRFLTLARSQRRWSVSCQTCQNLRMTFFLLLLFLSSLYK